MLISLNLQNGVNQNEKNRGTFSFATKRYEYSFSVTQAVESMRNLSLEALQNKASITIQYRINETTAHDLLSKFMAAKLLYTPADRTRNQPKEKVLLQPTPKGVAILQEFSLNIGLRQRPSILYSDLNSMELFNFERDLSSDQIQLSEGLIVIFFLYLMGPIPNVWSPSSPHDGLPPINKIIYKDDDIFNFGSESSTSDVVAEINSSEPPLKSEATTIKRQSPLAHKYFTNPNSDSHVQYYVSDKGVRISSKGVADVFRYNDFTFSTKSLWQWIMDCTDVLTPDEGVLVLHMLIKYELFNMLKVDSGSGFKPPISKDNYCQLSPKGIERVGWPSENTDMSTNNLPSVINNNTYIESSSNLESKTLTNIRLENILNEPGLRHIFKKHLEEEHCSENFNILIELKIFLKLMEQLRSFLRDDANSAENLMTSKMSMQKYYKTNIRKLTHNALEIAVHIYSTYVMVGSPLEVNINSQLKDEIESLFIGFKQSQSTTTEIADAESYRSGVGFCFEVPKKAHIHQSSSVYSNNRIFQELEQHSSDRRTESVNLRAIIEVLRNIWPYFSELNHSIYNILETDSLDRFKRSKKYVDVLDMILNSGHTVV